MIVRRITALQERMLKGIQAKLDGVVVNGSVEHRYAGNLNLSFAYVEGESLLMGLKEVAVSSGSAGTSASLEPSYVLRFGTACEIAKKEMQYDSKRITALQERMLKGIQAKLDGVVVNGSVEHQYTGNLNLSFAYVEGESLLMGLNEVAVSSGSACTWASLEPSYVLRALGVDEDMAHSSIRFGIGRFTTEEEIDRAVELTLRQVEKLREMSPPYELVKEAIDIKSIQWAQH